MSHLAGSVGRTTAAGSTHSQADKNLARRKQQTGLGGFQELFETPVPPAAAHLTGGQVLESVVYSRLRDMERQRQRGKPHPTATRAAPGPATTADVLRDEPMTAATPPPARRMGSLSPEAYLKLLGTFQKDSHDKNVMYLNLQEYVSNRTRQHDAISNLMKARHEAISRSVRESH